MASTSAHVISSSDEETVIPVINQVARKSTAKKKNTRTDKGAKTTCKGPGVEPSKGSPSHVGVDEKPTSKSKVTGADKSAKTASKPPVLSRSTSFFIDDVIKSWAEFRSRHVDEESTSKKKVTRSDENDKGASKAPVEKSSMGSVHPDGGPTPMDIDALFVPAPNFVTVPSQREPSKRVSAMKHLHKTASTFMADFNPDTSSREKRKLSRKLRSINHSHVKNKSKPKPPPPGALYDEFGIHLESGLDLCDCLEQDCDGCFFPCPKCGSEKCGNECRVHRDYVVEYE